MGFLMISYLVLLCYHQHLQSPVSLTFQLASYPLFWRLSLMQPGEECVVSLKGCSHISSMLYLIIQGHFWTFLKACVQCNGCLNHQTTFPWIYGSDTHWQLIFECRWAQFTHKLFDCVQCDIAEMRTPEILQNLQRPWIHCAGIFIKTYNCNFICNVSCWWLLDVQ